MKFLLSAFFLILAFSCAHQQSVVQITPSPRLENQRDPSSLEPQHKIDSLMEREIIYFEDIFTYDTYGAHADVLISKSSNITAVLQCTNDNMLYVVAQLDVTKSYSNDHSVRLGKYNLLNREYCRNQLKEIYSQIYSGKTMGISLKTGSFIPK